jgi:hypothetical protein
MTVGDITGEKDTPKKHPGLVRFGQLLGSIAAGICSSIVILALFPDTPKWALGMFATLIFGFTDTQFMIERIQKKLDKN